MVQPLNRAIFVFSKNTMKQLIRQILHNVNNSGRKKGEKGEMNYESLYFPTRQIDFLSITPYAKF